MGEGRDVYRSILVFAHSELRGALPAVVGEIKRAHGSRLILAVNTDDDRKAYAAAHPGLFEEIVTTDFRYRGLFEPMDDAAAWFAKARALEARHRFRFNHVLMDDRHLGIGFSAAGTNYPESRWFRAATHAKSVRAFASAMAFFEDLLTRHEISLVLGAPKSCAVIARSMGIETRYLVSSCFKDYWTWTVNEFMESDLIGQHVASGTDDCPDRLDGHYDIYLQVRKDMFDRFRARRMLANVAYEIARYLYVHARKLEKRIGLMLFENVRAHVLIWRQYRSLMAAHVAPLASLEGRRFVYFPLGVEPEVTLTRESPEFAHQAFAIHALAAALPADAVLAVKEHVAAIGMRPTDFYRDLAKIPNVVLLDPAEWGLDVIRRASAVATINGTSGFEAAVLGVPVLTFSVHARYSIVPHVRVVEGWHDVGPAVDEVLAAAEQPNDGRLAAGNRYLAAVVATSVDCPNLLGRTPPPPALVERIVALLDRTFAPGPASVASPAVSVAG